MVREKWIRYGSLMATIIASDDEKHNLHAEVRTRLKQLDIILDNPSAALAIVRPAPSEIERANAWFQENYSAFRHGKISWDAWIAGTSVSRDVDPRRYVDAWESVGLFVEAFYFFAWRLIEVWNREGQYAFPELAPVRALGVTIVRNHLLEHPERHGQNFTQGLVVTDAGPVLRSSGVVLKGATGEVLPADDTVDEGLYVTATRLRDELEVELDNAIRALET